jgi:hypothetical protein
MGWMLLGKKMGTAEVYFRIDDLQMKIGWTGVFFQAVIPLYGPG